ncbi:MAG: hypothetical protein KDC80_10020 [Saprospiraceae bacterium]|nr:hypothetical protein [Saprospiraceae bacterium]
MTRRRLSEIFLVLLITYTLIFLWNEHIGYLLCAILSVVVLAVFLISIIVEWIEPSKVPSSYFQLMWVLLLTPLITLVFFSLLKLI